MPTDPNAVLIENASIVFRNFEGKEGQYNRAGDRNFGLLLDDETAEAMLADGWNVKYLKVRDEDLEEDPNTTPQAWLPVTVGYSGKPPKIVMITARGKTNLDEETVAQLDWVDIENIDMIIRPYDWEVNGNTGRKAYLKSMFVTIDEDELERKYADMEEQ